VTALAPAEAYSLWAPSYGAETAVSALEASLVDALDVDLRGKRVLDAGCGIGRRLRDATHAGAAAVLGIDLTPRMLEQADRDALLAAGDVRAIPAGDAAFDVVWCRLVLGHLPDIRRSYHELARVCAAGGVVIVSDFHPDAVAAGHRRTFRDASGVVHEVEHHVHSPDAHVAAAARAGLSLTARRDGVVGEEVRDHYARASRLEAYDAHRGLPIVLVLAFARGVTAR
jgi:malonyl-CoA O-methyltransferase